MSANINSIAYSGEKPWHGLGKKVDGLLTSAEAIKEGGLDFTVEKRPLFLENGVRVPQSFATVRTDTNDVLGTVGKKYTILQNKDSFSFFDAVVGIKEAIYEVVGSLGKGEKIWLLAKLPGYIQTKGDDITEKYLLLSNSHDGSGSVNVLFTPIRVVCQNTLNVAVDSSSNKVKLRHTLNIGSKINEVQEQLGIINQKFTILEEASRKLATVDLTEGAFEDYLKNSGVVPKADDEEQSGRSKNIINEVTNLFEYGKGANLPGVKGTAWGAFNAVAEFVDHKRGKNLEKRAASLLYGSGAILKQKAWDQAIALIK